MNIEHIFLPISEFTRKEKKKKKKDRKNLTIFFFLQQCVRNYEQNRLNPVIVYTPKYVWD